MWAPEKRKRIEVDSPTTYYILGKQTDDAGLFAGPTLVLGATRSIKIKVIFNSKIKSICNIMRTKKEDYAWQFYNPP